MHKFDFNRARLQSHSTHHGLELSLAKSSSQRMLQRSPIYVGDLKPIGVARPLAVVRPGDSLSSLVTISISCLSTLTLLAAGAAWLVPHGGWISTTFTQRSAPVVSTEPSAPSAFPSWIEVPHLTGPLTHANDPDTFSVADGPRTFLDPNPADAVEQPAFLPPRANPHLLLIGRAPLDAARLTREQPPAWNKRPDRRDIATVAPPSAVATLEPDVLQSPQDRVETTTARTLAVDPIQTLVLPSRSAPVRAPTEVVIRPAPPVVASPPPERVATLSPDPTRQAVDQKSPITPPSDIGVVIAPILNPGPARHARSLRKPRAATAASQAQAPYRDAEQTASIISRPTAARGRIDAGAVAYASMHRARGNRATSARPSAPSSPWTLPPALAPTD